MKRLARALWRLIPARWQWTLCWLFNAKFNVGVAGVVRNGAGQVLLLEHVLRNHHPWGLPAGWVERGETVEAALHREVMEETGIHIEVGDVIQVNSGFRTRLDVFLVATTAATVQIVEPAHLSIELFSARFFPADDLPANLAPAHRRLIEAVCLDGEPK